MKYNFFKSMCKSSQSGSALVSTVMITGLSVALMGYVAASQSSQAKAQRVSDMQGDRVALQAYIAKGLDCKATITNMKSACVADAPIALSAKSIDNPILIDKAVISKKVTTYPKIGQYKMLVTCAACETPEGCPKGNKIVIKYSLGTLPFEDLYDPKRLPDCEVPF